MINLPVYKTSEKIQTIIKRGPHAKLSSISLSISSMTISNSTTIVHWRVHVLFNGVVLNIVIRIGYIFFEIGLLLEI